MLKADEKKYNLNAQLDKYAKELEIARFNEAEKDNIKAELRIKNKKLEEADKRLFQLEEKHNQAIAENDILYDKIKTLQIELDEKKYSLSQYEKKIDEVINKYFYVFILFFIRLDCFYSNDKVLNIKYALLINLL